MNYSVRQIIVEDLRFEKSAGEASGPQTKALNWKINAGCIWVVTGGSGAGRTLLLRVLAGLERPAGGKILISHGEGKPPERLHESEIGIAYLPPLGDETFTGTTVEEELLFYLESKDNLEEKLDSVTENFGFDFKCCLGRSVWELSASQRRCLLLISQALVLPPIWVCDQPLALLDSRRARAVTDFFRCEANRGAAIIAALIEAGQVLDLAHKVLIIDERREVVYQGKTSSVPPDTAVRLGWNPALYRKGYKNA